MGFGPAAGLELIEALTSEPSLKAYHLLPSVRCDFLFKLGRFAEAQAEFERAASLTRTRTPARPRPIVRRRATAARPTVRKARRLALCAHSRLAE
jgi:predicted RNA polymerase sigma factor